MSSRPTIHDVAKAAGVSPTTVSHALSGKGRVDPSTRERVRRVAAELGYRPSALAKGMRLGISNQIGLLVSEPSFGGTDHAALGYRIAYAVAERAATGGRAIVFVPAGLSEDDARHLTCDGVIDPGLGEPGATVRALRALDVPMIGFSASVPTSSDGWVVAFDVPASTRSLLDALRRAGARAPGIVVGNGWGAWSDEAVRSYRDWCETHDTAPAVLETANPASQETSGAPSGAGKIDGLLVLGTPDVALVAAAATGLAVPSSGRITCLTIGETPSRGASELTVARPPIDDIAGAAVDLLVRRLAGDPAPAHPPAFVAIVERH